MRVLVYGMSGHLLGGIETFLLNMNKHMSNDLIFDYIIEGPVCIHKAEIENRGGIVYHIAMKKKHLIKSMLDTWKLLKLKKKDHPTIYFNIISLFYSIPIYMSLLLGYRVIVHSHNNKLGNYNHIFRLFHKINEKLLMRCKIERLTNSQLSAEYLFGKAQGAEIIYNAVELEKFRFNLDTRNSIRTAYHIADKLVVGFVGRIVYEKNPLFLIEVFNEILKLRPDAVLVIAGDGALKEQVTAYITKYKLSNSVLMLGACNNVHELLQGMDLFLLPSKGEGLGIVLIEAQAAGLPCITSEGVVPIEAKATELLSFIPLESGAEVWAKECLAKFEQSKQERGYWYNKMKDSSFNIDKEAKRLEQIVWRCNN